MEKNKQHNFFSWFNLEKKNKKEKNIENKVINKSVNLVTNKISNSILSIDENNKKNNNLFNKKNTLNIKNINKSIEKLNDASKYKNDIGKMTSKKIVNFDSKKIFFSSIKKSLKLSTFTSVLNPKNIKKDSLLTRLKNSLIKTKKNIGFSFWYFFRGKNIDTDLFQKLEEKLLISDIGIETTHKIITTLVKYATKKQLKNAELLYDKLKIEMANILNVSSKPLCISNKNPYIILIVGVNGVGKTTTIGKMAHYFQKEGKSVILAAGDTFRPTAIEQLQIWGDRNKISVISQHTGSDSASVIFDAIITAKKRNVDILIADTAGRLQNKIHLMEELKKIVRVIKKIDIQAPHEIMLILDATTGQNSISQAKTFHEAIGLTGITLTKLDGTAKGGIIFAISDQLGIPIRYISIGEQIEDLRLFQSNIFIEALFS